MLLLLHNIVRWHLPDRFARQLKSYRSENFPSDVQHP